ncbi:MAG: glycosyltransferase, partial [Actinomycetota bacterium]|nr:glycosyltransferase [Actinomycetota bacterium]
MPARNEAVTVADVVAACLQCRFATDVIVVDDGSDDETAAVAAAAGARVVRRGADSGPGSKAHAMEAGVAVSGADAFLFVDADCIGLRPSHLDAICRPFLEGRAAMSVGWFDYGLWN